MAARNHRHRVSRRANGRRLPTWPVLQQVHRRTSGNRRGSQQDQILDWMVKLHGFSASPTGGGIRHGLDLTDSNQVQIDEARLYCNLIRSYITYLITEHERLRG